MDSINGSVGAVILLIVGISVALISLIFVGALTGQTFNIVEGDIAEISNNVILSEGFTANNASAESLAHSYIQEGSLSVLNSSDEVIGLSNFTVDYTAGTMLYLNDDAQNGSTMYVNYTWGVKSVRQNVQGAIGGGFESLEQTGSYMPVVVLAVIIALVLSLVLGFSGVGSRVGSGGVL